jgi:hypothetical protein
MTRHRDFIHIGKYLAAPGRWSLTIGGRWSLARGTEPVQLATLQAQRLAS